MSRKGASEPPFGELAESKAPKFELPKGRLWDNARKGRKCGDCKHYREPFCFGPAKFAPGDDTEPIAAHAVACKDWKDNE